MSENSYVFVKVKLMIYKRNYVKRKGEMYLVVWVDFNFKMFSCCFLICLLKLINYLGKLGWKYDDWCNIKDNFVDLYD